MNEQSGSTGAEPAARETRPGVDEHLTLAQAAKLAPGRPSANCVWRWCREGVKAASGQRVRLKHVRFGSRIYTTRRWLHDFGLALAEADAAHFDRAERARDEAASAMPARRTRRRRASTKQIDDAKRRHEEAVRELEEAGL